MLPTPHQALQGLAIFPKCQQALYFQDHSCVLQLIRQFVLHCDSELCDNGTASDLSYMSRHPDIALRC